MNTASDQIAMLKAEAVLTPTGLGIWAATALETAQTLISGNDLLLFGVECINIVYLGECSKDFSAKAWPVFQSPMGLESKVLNSPCATDALEAKLAMLIEVDEYNNRPDTNALIRGMMEEASAKYPELGLSYGYIENYNIGFGNAFDDRSFCIFTKLRDQNGYSVTFGGYSSDNLGRLFVEARHCLDRWCNTQRELLQEGKLYSVASAKAA
jgi:hypothetical protein